MVLEWAVTSARTSSWTRPMNSTNSWPNRALLSQSDSTLAGMAISMKGIFAAIAFSAVAVVGGENEQPAPRAIANYPPSDEEIRQMYDAEYLDPIDLNVPPIATDKSVKYDYDIVY